MSYYSEAEHMAALQAIAEGETHGEAVVMVNRISPRGRTGKSISQHARMCGLRFKRGRPKVDDEGVIIPKRELFGEEEFKHRREMGIRTDQKFQEAMFVAGYAIGVNTNPGTDNPRPIASAIFPIGGSCAGWGQ